MLAESFAAAITGKGGLSIAQQPEQARPPSMPVNAIREDDVDAVLRLHEIAAILPLLAAGRSVELPRSPHAGLTTGLGAGSPHESAGVNDQAAAGLYGSAGPRNEVGCFVAEDRASGAEPLQARLGHKAGSPSFARVAPHFADGRGARPCRTTR